MSTTWKPIASVSQTTIPYDFTGNSLSLAPVAGDSTPVGITLSNGTSTLFKVDASGNFSAATSSISGNETVGGTLGVSGLTTLAALSAASASVSANASVGGTLSVVGQTSLAALSASSANISGNETVGGTLSVTGLLTATAGLSAPFVRTTQTGVSSTIAGSSYIVSNVQLPGIFGDGYGYPSSGISSDSLGNLSFNYQGIPAFRMSNPGYNSSTGTTPSTAYPLSFLNGSYTFAGGGNTLLSLSSTTAKYGFSANTVPFTMQAFSGNILVLQNGGSAPNYTTTTVGAVSSAGLASFTGLALTSTTGLTFADNTVQTTAFNAASAGTLSKFTATANGTTAAPVFTYSNNTDTGLYLKTSSTTAAVLGVSVNATDAITLTKTGVSVPAALSVSGASSLAALTTTGLITAPNITLGTSGKLTFGDGTSLASAAQGAAPSFTASGNGTVSAPVFTFSNNTDSGLYLSTSSTTAAVVGFTVNATSALTLQKTGIYVPGTSRVDGLASFNGGISSNGVVTATGITLSSSGNKLTFGDGTSQTTAASAGTASTFTATAANGGSASAPLFLSSLATNTGIYFGSASVVSFAANGTNVMNIGSTQVNIAVPLSLNGANTINGATTFNGGAVTFANQSMSTGGTWTASSFAANSGGSLTTPGLNFGNTSSNSGFYYPSSSLGVAGVQAGVSCFNFTSSLFTLSTPATTAKTITSTTAAGTPSFVSSQGFKTIIEGSYWRTSYVANAVWTVTRPQYDTNAGSAAASDLHFGCAFAGSVVGLVLIQYGSSTGTSSLNVVKNGSSSNLISWSPGTNNTGVPYTISYAKGTYSFAAGDSLTFTTSNTAAGEVKIIMYAYIEMGA